MAAEVASAAQDAGMEIMDAVLTFDEARWFTWLCES